MNILLSVPGQSGGTNITDPSIKNRLLVAGRDLFADNGYAGTSVREICAHADASVPMIKHYFGNKEGLFRAILDQFSAEAFDVPVRLIEGELRSREDFLTKLELFISETFTALLSQAPIFRISSRDGPERSDFTVTHTALVEFLKQAQSGGYIRASLDVEMVSGLLFDRLGNQVLYAVQPNAKGPNALSDEDYRRRWLKANTDTLLFGLAGE